MALVSSFPQWCWCKLVEHLQRQVRIQLINLASWGGVIGLIYIYMCIWNINVLKYPSVLLKFYISAVPEWRHQASEWKYSIWRSCGDLLEWDLGHYMWWILVRIWCTSGLQTAGILNNWLEMHGIEMHYPIVEMPLRQHSCPCCHFFFVILRICLLLQCLLWTRIWSHLPGWSALHWTRDKDYRLSKEHNYRSWWCWLLPGTSWWCWTEMSREYVDS